MRPVRKLLLISIALAALLGACEMRDTERTQLQKDEKEDRNFTLKDPDPAGTRLEASLGSIINKANTYQVVLGWNGWSLDETEVFRSENGQAAVRIAHEPKLIGNYTDTTVKAAKYTYYLKVTPKDGTAPFESWKVEIEVPLDFAISPGENTAPARRKYGFVHLQKGARLTVPKDGLLVWADVIINEGATIEIEDVHPDVWQTERAIYIRAKHAIGKMLKLDYSQASLPNPTLVPPLAYIRIDSLKDGFDILGPAEIVGGCMHLGGRVGKYWKQLGCAEIEKHFETKLLKN